MVGQWHTKVISTEVMGPSELEGFIPTEADVTQSFQRSLYSRLINGY